MSTVRSHSSPDLLPSSPGIESSSSADRSLEGVAANMMLVVKLIREHNEVSNSDRKDINDRAAERVASMINILDDAKSRIQKSQPSAAPKKELRRCMTELRPPRNTNIVIDEKDRLKKQLNAALTAQKSLQMMCSTLGKEKEIMASELSRKVGELDGMEELIGDLKAQNENLLNKLNKERKVSSSMADGNINVRALQEKNKELSEQLLKSLDGYKSLKRKLKEVREERTRLRSLFDETGEEIMPGCIHRLNGIRERIKGRCNGEEEVEEEIDGLEKMLKGFELKASEFMQRKS